MNSNSVFGNNQEQEKFTSTKDFLKGKNKNLGQSNPTGPVNNDTFETISATLRSFIEFRGRASVKEFWNFYIPSGALIIFFTIFNPIIGTSIFVVLFLPGLSLGVRRLHDQNRSGLYALLVLVPFGLLVLILWATEKGTDGSNDYGPDPLKQSNKQFESEKSSHQTGSTATTTVNFCSACGKKIKPDDSFCSGCGAAV